MTSKHFETIKCPECNTIQEAEVEHTEPWWTHVHECKKCEYIITESEWDVIPIRDLKEN